MITFNQFENVEDMNKCRKKPIEVMCKQINEPFQVNTLEGLMQGKAGDYLIKGITGELYPCDQDIFNKTYEIRYNID